MAGEALNRMVGKARKSQHQQDMEALQRGATQSGSLVAPAPAPKPEPAPEVSEAKLKAMRGDYPTDEGVAAQQAANLANPSLQDKLNAVARARAKFYGEAK
jgi:hypothetical protein